MRSRGQMKEVFVPALFVCGFIVFAALFFKVALDNIYIPLEEKPVVYHWELLPCPICEQEWLRNERFEIVHRDCVVQHYLATSQPVIGYALQGRIMEPFVSSKIKVLGLDRDCPLCGGPVGAGDLMVVHPSCAERLVETQKKK